MGTNPSGLKGFFKKGAQELSPVEGQENLHRTLGLKEFLARLETRGKVHLLEMGPALQENINYLGGRNYKVYIQDFFEELRQARRDTTADQGFSFEGFLDRVFPYPNNSFDGVLAWDVFNYLPPKDANTLARRLYLQMKVGGVLLAFFSSSKTIPDVPLIYRVIDTNTLQYDSNPENQRTAPNFTNNEIVKMMDRFAVVNFYFLRNGVREALLAKK
ncbi:MAG TPA: methyltransferase domain-containing protein [Acidobacteriota bacterium]|jgi:hypothetical protein